MDCLLSARCLATVLGCVLWSCAFEGTVVPPADGTGGAGSTTTTTSSSSGGGGSGGGSVGSGGGGGCVSDCGERLCGLDVCGDSCGTLLPTWSLATPIHSSELLVHEASSSLFGTGDITNVDRINLCTGQILASAQVGVAVNPHSLRGLGVFGDDLLVATNNLGKVGSVFVLDRQTLAPSDTPIPVTALATATDNIWIGVAHDGAFWLGPDDDGDALIRVDPLTRVATRYDTGTQTFGRGLASTPTGLVQNWGDKRLALFDTPQCTTTCPAPATTAALATLGFKLAYDSDAVFHVSFEGDVGSLTRVDMPAFTTLTRVVNDVGTGLDGWVDVAVYNGVVYVSGVSGGITGLTWLAAYPVNFTTASTPMFETFLESKGDVAWSIAADQFGVYVGGAIGSTGFVIKCTHELDCPALP